MSKVSVGPTRGMRDLLPVDVSKRNAILSIIREVYTSHGFFEIETPIVESLEILGGGGGGENEKLIFKILKRGESLEAALSDVKVEDSLADYGLRFDLTVPLARFYAGNQHRLPNPFRSCQIGPVFRAERPQKGRFRQFQQVDIDVLGDDGPQAEVDLLSAAISALLGIGIKGFTVRLNDRRILEALASNFGFGRLEFGQLFISLDKLDKLEAAQVVDELVQKGFDGPRCYELVTALSELEASGDSLAALAEHRVPTDLMERLLWITESVTANLDPSTSSDFDIAMDPLVIRGMAYYTSSVFEIAHSGWGTSIAGGGRYDEMLSRLSKPAPACGISLGFERIMGLMAEVADSGADLTARRRTTVIYDPRDQTTLAADLVSNLRSSGEIATQQMRAKNLGSQLKRLEAEANEQISQGSKDRFFVQIIGRGAVTELGLAPETRPNSQQ